MGFYEHRILFQVLLGFCVICMVDCSKNNLSVSTPVTGNASQHENIGIKIFKFEFNHVATPFVVCCWVLLASLTKIGFHHSEWVSSTIPESCMLILLGLPIGFILNAVHAKNEEQIFLSSELFFYYLLPPIILDAGYFMPSQVFYKNIGTILLYAVLGTIFNTFAVGVSLYATVGISDVNMTLLQALLFGSLISAVDPVAVLAVFEEVHVHEVLYMLVFGESVLNDAASVVLYRTFESLAEGTVNVEQISLAFASFFVVSIGGTAIGVLFALTTGFITKFTEHVRVIEPALVFLMAYMSYLAAEIFHFSGIMSILFCGIIMKPYVESNVSRKSHTTIKYFLKLLSSACESLIFMFLGVSLVYNKHEFNFSFVCLTLLFITIYRAVGVVILTAVANRFGRLTKVKRVEQFIMSYGGLRGAVAFSLAVLIKVDNSGFRDVVLTTTMSVVIFTVFVQGTTIKKLVEVLGVKRAQKREKTMAETLNDRVLGYMAAGIEDIIGVHRHGYFLNLLEHLNKKYIRKLLVRDPHLLLDENLVNAERRMAFKHALCYATNPAMIYARQNDEAQLNELKKNPSFAMQLAIQAQEAKGAECGIIDMNILSKADTPHSITGNSEAFNRRTIAGLIPKPRKLAKRTYSKRKYSLDSLEEKEDIEEDYIRIKQEILSHRNANSMHLEHRPTKHREHRQHRHRKHKHKKSSKRPEMDTLQEFTEIEDDDMTMRSSNEGLQDDSHSESDDEEEGIHFKRLNSVENKMYEDDDFVPSLPIITDDLPVISLQQDASAPILDNSLKLFSQRDQDDLNSVQRCRKSSLDSVVDISSGDDVFVKIN